MHRPLMTRHRGAMCAVALVALAPVVAACGGSSNSTNSTSATNPTTAGTSAHQTTTGSTSTAPSTTTGAVTTTGTSSAPAPAPTTTTITTTTGAAPAPAPTSTTPSAVTTILNIRASASELAFIPDALSAPAGRIVIRMTNPSQLQHSVALAVPNVAPGAVVGYGGVSEVVATLAPGTYTYYCTVPGDRQAGMTGTLTVY